MKGTKPKTDRNKRIVNYREKQKKSFAEIGRIEKITRQRAKFLYDREKKRKEG